MKTEIETCQCDICRSQDVSLDETPPAETDLAHAKRIARIQRITAALEKVGRKVCDAARLSGL